MIAESAEAALSADPSGTLFWYTIDQLFARALMSSLQVVACARKSAQPELAMRQ